MSYVLSLILISTFGLAMQTCGTSETASKTAPAKPAAETTAAANTAAENPAADEAQRITLANAKKDFDAGTATFVDTRGAEFYNLERIKGAINIPNGEFEARYKKIPTDKKIIVYCS